jgi:hypothetical protein
MHVDEPKAAAALANSRLRRLLMLFASGPLSLSEAAARGRVDLKRLHHHACRLVDLGLLEICGVRARAGRPIKLYRAVSDAFFIPEEMFPRPFGEELANELRDCLAAESIRSSRGLLLTVGPNGEPLGRVVQAPERPADAFELWRVMRLSPGDVARLKSEIDVVLRRFQSRPRGSSHVYLVHAAAARRRDESGPIDNP